MLHNKINRNIRKVVVPGISLLVFFQGCIVLLFLQVTYKTIYCRNAIRRQSGLNETKRLFIVLLSSILHVVAPSAVKITTENATIPKGTFFKDLKENRILSHLKSNSVAICNHQIYTDWIFLWWLAYTSNLAANVFIILKKSLASIPILGYGMRNYNFIFMSRKWAQDKITMSNSLAGIDSNARGIGSLAGKSPERITEEGESIWNPEIIDPEQILWPYNLVLFPEGTNLSADTRQKSAKYAAKIGKEPFKNVLLPHSTGLRFSLQQLKPSVEVLYDITIGYSGLKKEEYGEQVYGFKSIFLEGRYPKLVDIHIRAFNVDDIPLNDENEFSNWLYKIWGEKDVLMEKYYSTGSFITDAEINHSVTDSFKINLIEITKILILPALTTLWLVYKLFVLFF
ncbi:putative acyltransferase cst26 [Saccharomyces pastorianus]|uniref:Putative acyltransferase cst26 n=1 Tax=Saccharomyces pastorianus TaxID=27292 RepID=A0A6C1E4K5_SACPS|nr:putative acyltransferase cst26 [Saccharomyces pastorianus]